MKAKLTKPALTGMVICLTAMAMLSGCTDPDSSEFQRLVCEVSQINGGSPMICAYIDVGDPSNDDDDTMPVDFAIVAFHARPYSSYTILAEDGPFSYFHITEYDLIYHPLQTQGADMELFNMYGCGIDVLVPVNETAEVVVMVADRYMKDTALFADLAAGTREPFTAQVEFIFRGHETGNQYQQDHPVEIRGSFMVHCLGAVAQ